jgi:hypothetical protein
MGPEPRLVDLSHEPLSSTTNSLRTDRNTSLTVLIDQLLEDPIIVTQPVTPYGQVERSSGIEVTSCQPAQTSVTQSGVPLFVQEVFKVEPELAHGLGDHVLHVQVEDGVVEGPSL